MKSIMPWFKTAAFSVGARLGGSNVRAVSNSATSRTSGLRTGLLIAMGLAAVTSASALQLTVGWDINSADQLGFNVERSTDGTNFSQVATVAATANSYTDLNVPAGPLWYRVRAFNATTYSAYSNVATTQTAVSAPSFTTQPSSQSVAAGSVVTFKVVVAGAPVPTVQWTKNGAPISGATSTTLSLSNVSSADAATYKAVATNSAGSVTSIGAVLTLSTAIAPPVVVEASRLQRFSARALPGKSDQAVGVDFVVKGASKTVLVRGVGPGLSSFTTAAVMVDPTLTLRSGSTVVASNDNWGGSSTLSALFSRVGAFPLATASKDAALSKTLATGSYSTVMGGRTGGLAMLEVYDADSNGGRISQLDVRAGVSVGESRLIVGFTIAGTQPMRVVIRGIGPGLGGIRNLLVDPQLEVHSGSTLIAKNDNWGGTSELSASFTAAGAPRLSTLSKDAAVDITLAPGTYTATVSGVDGTRGIAQLEIYERP